MANTGQAAPPEALTDIANQSQHPPSWALMQHRCLLKTALSATRTNQLELVQRIKYVCHSGYWIYAHSFRPCKTWFVSRVSSPFPNLEYEWGPHMQEYCLPVWSGPWRTEAGGSGLMSLSQPTSQDTHTGVLLVTPEASYTCPPSSQLAWALCTSAG